MIEPQEAQGPSSPGPTGHQLLGRLGERIQAILDQAEAAAVEIHANAAAEAARYLRERRREADRLIGEREQGLTEWAQTAVSRASHIKRELEGLVDFMDDAIERLNELDPATPDTVRTTSPAEAKPAPERGHSSRISDEALLRVTQMAVTGRDRTELVRTLRDEFGIDDPAAVLDQIIGAPGPDRGHSLGAFRKPAGAKRPERMG